MIEATLTPSLPTTNTEQTSFAIDSIKDTQTTVAAMKAAATTLKAETKKLNIDQIEDTQDDLQDMMEDMNEINDMMGRAYGMPDEIDEADLDAELACLEDELEGFEEGETEAAPSYLQSARMHLAVTRKHGHDRFGLGRWRAGRD